MGGCDSQCAKYFSIPREYLFYYPSVPNTVVNALDFNTETHPTEKVSLRENAGQSQQNEIVHWDFFTLGEGLGRLELSFGREIRYFHFCEPFPCTTPTSYIAAEVSSLWCGR
ncbi:Hypothetical protein PHPALM_36423 [Phytophthora palmivora]|uniref:Uncharacterized protein n=1 Tax=Phytophthora palmivora TaxID=4796 RepID=A0A2P4WZZ5_9STRA|nr:Hypothetical protein PHPALM_36423 [Phytophthora palmivora]